MPTLAVGGAKTADSFGYHFSGAPIVTSPAGTAGGSALTWVSYAPAAWGDGELRAYVATPDALGNLELLFRDAYGRSSKFSVPGVGAGRVYMGTSDGYVVGYGSPAPSILSGGPLDFGAVVTGRSETLTLVLTVQAREATEVTAISTSNAAFAAGASTPPLPATLAAGATLSVPVTFAPTMGQPYIAGLDLTTSGGEVAVTLEGTSLAKAAKLTASPPSLTFGGLATGTSATTSVALTNAGESAFTFSSVRGPAAPYDVEGLPAAGQVLASGASVALSVTFAPTSTGTFSDSIALSGTSGTLSVYLSGTSAPASQLMIAPLMIDYGAASRSAARPRGIVR